MTHHQLAAAIHETRLTATASKVEIPLADDDGTVVLTVFTSARTPDDKPNFTTAVGLQAAHHWTTRASSGDKPQYPCTTMDTDMCFYGIEPPGVTARLTQTLVRGNLAALWPSMVEWLGIVRAGAARNR